MNDDIRTRIRAIGNQMVPQMFADTIALFAPGAPRAEDVAKVSRNITYGPHERHCLDLFVPKTSGSGLPVVVFVHGGGFVQGDKGVPDAPFYNNFGAWAAASGFIGLTINYRLAPDHGWPAGAQDLALLVDWLRDHAAEHGGDAARIFLVGQSAGAAHVASYVAMPSLHGNGPRIAGAIMLSGIYDVVQFPHGPFEDAYYGTDPSRFAGQSSLRGLVESSVPCLFTVAEYDPPQFQAQAALLVQSWFEAKGEYPRMLYLPDGNHMSGATALGRAGDVLSGELAAFVRKFSGKSANSTTAIGVAPG